MASRTSPAPAVATANPPERSVHGVRAAIAEIDTEIARVQAAALPIAELESSIRGSLSALLAPAERISTRATQMLSASRRATASDFIGDTSATDEIAQLALSLALRAVGVDAIVAEALRNVELDESMQGAPLRLSVAERDARIAELLCERYVLEVEDVALCESAGIPLRAGVTPAAALGVPVEIAAKHGLFGG